MLTGSSCRVEIGPKDLAEVAERQNAEESRSQAPSRWQASPGRETAKKLGTYGDVGLRGSRRAPPRSLVVVVLVGTPRTGGMARFCCCCCAAHQNALQRQSTLVDDTYPTQQPVTQSSSEPSPHSRSPPRVPCAASEARLAWSVTALLTCVPPYRSTALYGLHVSVLYCPFASVAFVRLARPALGCPGWGMSAMCVICLLLLLLSPGFRLVDIRPCSLGNSLGGRRCWWYFDVQYISSASVSRKNFDACGTHTGAQITQVVTRSYRM